MDQAAHQEQQLHAQQELEAVYAKIARAGRYANLCGKKDLSFTEDELALVRWAFGITTH